MYQWDPSALPRAEGWFLSAEMTRARTGIFEIFGSGGGGLLGAPVGSVTSLGRRGGGVELGVSDMWGSSEKDGKCCLQETVFELGETSVEPSFPSWGDVGFVTLLGPAVPLVAPRPCAGRRSDLWTASGPLPSACMNAGASSFKAGALPSGQRGAQL